MPEPASLVADIGGTHVRFALSPDQDRRALRAVRVMAIADYDTVERAAKDYLDDCGAPPVRQAVFGIANPVLGDRIRMTNAPWSFSIDATRQALGLERLHVINDFTALAWSLTVLAQADLRQLGGRERVPATPLGLLGPGTGLGVSALVPAADGRWTPIAGEGGHVSFAPRTERELALWRAAHARFGHVSMERLVSGMGLEFIYRTVAGLAGAAAPDRTAAQISADALDGSCPHCREALDTFCALLGTAAGDLALTLGARGGIYLGGGILPKLGDYFMQSPFRRRFEDKGRFSDYLARIPVFLITTPHAALLGAAACIDTLPDLPPC